MLEFTAGCGFLFAMGPDRPLALYGFAFGVLSIWSLRVKHWALRMALCQWLASICAFLLGVASLERAFTAQPGVFSLNLWMWLGFSLVVAAPLAMVNGCLFAVTSWASAPHRKRTS